MTMDLPPGFDPKAPIVATTPIDGCAVCGAHAFAPSASGYDYELMTCRNRWHMLSCEQCGHTQLDPRPADSTMSTIYPPHYYSYDMAKHVNHVALKAKAWLDGQKFARIFRTMKREPHTYLDVGCGDLKYLRAMERKGLAPPDIYGVELSENAVTIGNALGYRVFNEPLEKLESIPSCEIDLATMFHVIEHVADPGMVLRRIRELLTPGGCLVVETPNFSSLDARLFQRSFWGGYHFPRHWHIFRPETLTRLLEESGFSVIRMWYGTGHSFWLYSLHHSLKFNRSIPLPWLAKFFDPLRNLLFLSAFTLWDVIRAKLKFQTSAMIFVCRIQAKP